MANKKLIEQLKKKCVKFLEKSKLDKNEKNIQLYSTIYDILNSNEAFDKLDMETSLNVLMDLGCSLETALKLYNELIKS